MVDSANLETVRHLFAPTTDSSIGTQPARFQKAQTLTSFLSAWALAYNPAPTAAMCCNQTKHSLSAQQSPAGDGEDGLLDLRDGEVLQLLKFDVRHVWHLVGDHDGVDDRRAIDGESLADRRLQITRLPGSISVP